MVGTENRVEEVNLSSLLITASEILEREGEREREEKQ